MIRLNWRFLIGIAVLVGIAGCPGGDADRPDRVKVTGTVTYNGSAVEDAVVTFSPKAVAGHAATGTTDASGNFSLSTFESGDGAVPGSYAVTIRKTEGGPTDVAIPGGTESDEDVAAAYAAAEKQQGDVFGGPEGRPKEQEPETKELLPAKYKDPNASGLTADVTESGENHFPFNLED